MQNQIRDWLEQSLSALRKQGLDLPDIQPRVSSTKKNIHGDYTSNVALILAPATSLSAPELAHKIIQQLPHLEQLNKAQMAGAGFINFYLQKDSRVAIIHDVIAAASPYAHNKTAHSKRILLEYVSANPTGPLHVGHGRGAAYGETLACMLKAVGHQVDREYYVNDSGRQMDVLVLSTWLRYLELVNGVSVIDFPKKAYQGDYIYDLAAAVRNQHRDSFLYTAEQIEIDKSAVADDPEAYLTALVEKCHQLLGEENYLAIHQIALSVMVDNIKLDLKRFGVEYENWFSERSLFDNGEVQKAIDILQERDHVYQSEGALWFRSTTFGDDKDRVLQKSNGDFTYFASDIAYHWNKYQRGYDLMINIWGADHHGYVTRLKTAIQAMGLDKDKLVIILVQFANLYRGQEKMQMSTRSGEFVTLNSLCKEVGVDATRFFYVMRKPSQHLDFDIELAKADSVNNPLYYVQYAHARICSVFRQLRERKMVFEYDAAMSKQLDEPEEQELIKLLYTYQAVLNNATDNFEAQALLNFVRDIATCFHGYYNRCQFLVDDEPLRQARLSLLQAVQITLKESLQLFGVSALEKM